MIPDPLNLDPGARLFMLAWIRSVLSFGVNVTADDWREAYGRAADHETVSNARLVLDEVAA